MDYNENTPQEHELTQAMQEVGNEAALNEEAGQTPEKKPKRSILYDFYSLLHDLVYILAAITLIFVFLVRLVSVNGSSMLPTLRHGDYLALQSNVIMGELEQGDIIVARKLNFENGEPIVKRVVATEGQTVDIRYSEDGVGTVFVDGVALDEPYINGPMDPKYTGSDGTQLPLTVGEGCIFVMGDNRNHSADSRYYEIGEIKLDQVLGKVLLIVFPGLESDLTRDFDRFGTVE